MEKQETVPGVGLGLQEGLSLELHLDCGRKRAAKAKWGLPRYMGWKNSIWISSSKTQMESKNYS